MKILTYNPYDWNSIALRKDRENKEELIPTAEQLITSPVHNFMAKYLGIDTKHEWNQHYEKVHLIVEWAKKKTQSEDLQKLTEAVSDLLNRSPQMNEKRIVDLFVAVKLDNLKKEPKEGENENDQNNN